MPLVQWKGRVSFLRVHEVGSGWGPRDDHLDAEVIVRLDRSDRLACGFKLRADADLPVHRAMFDLLQSAFVDKAMTTLDVDLARGQSNGTLLRVWVGG